MIRKTVEIASKTITQDGAGRVTGETFTPTGKIRCDYIMPFSSFHSMRTYGFTEQTTHRTFTPEVVEVNNYLIDGDKTYHIVEVAEHNRVFVLLLERVS